MFKVVGRNNRLLMLALFIWALGEGLWYNNFRQLYLVQLGATSTQVGMALAIEMVMRALMPIPAGLLADRIGTYKVMVASWFLGVLGTLVCGIAGTWQVFVPGLVIYGMSAFAMPAVSAYALQNIPDRTRPRMADRALTSIFAAYTAGLIISPLIGGIIAESWGIGTGLWISTAIFVASTACILLASPAPPDESTDLAEHPTDLLRNPRFVWMSVYFVVVFTALFTSYQLIPNYLQEARGLSMGTIGLLFSIAAAGTVVLNGAAGRAGPGWSFAAVAGVYGLALLGVWRGQQPVILWVAFFGAGGLSVLRTLALARAADVVSARNQGLAFGIIETLNALAGAVASGIAGWLYGLTPAHDLPLIVALVAVPLLIGLWFALGAWHPAPAAEDRLIIAAD